MIPIALLLALVPQEVWTALPLPGICVEPAAAPHAAPLLEGEHLLLRRERAPRGGAELRRPAPAPLPASQLVGLIQEDARRAGSALTFLPSGSQLLVRGPEAQVADLRARLADLDAVGERLEIELEAWLAPGAAAGELEPSAESAADARAAGLGWRGRARSGEELMLGERESLPFVSGFQVDVASDSGVAAPVLGRASLGESLHIIASRVAGGTRVHLEGLLDLAQLEGVESFDPGTPDLGIVQQPIVRTLQVAFSGVVEDGEPLRVSVSGTPLDPPDWTLWVRARTQPDPAPRRAPGWELVDVALLTRMPRVLPGLEPGALLEGAPSGAVLPRVIEQITTSALTAGAGSDRRSGFPTASDRLVLIERGDGSATAALRELGEALEAPRLMTRRVELEHGGMRASFPVTHGAPARLRAGVERTWLLDYDAQIAPDTWMPAPIVERAFDGLAWQGVLVDARLECTYWIASTLSATTRSLEEARLGALQLPVRRLRGDAGGFPADGAEHELLPPSPRGAPALSLRTSADRAASAADR